MRAARDHSGLSQQQFAVELGYTRSGVGHWESGRRLPSRRDQLAISKVTGYPMPGSPLAQALAAGGPAGEMRHVTAARWELAFEDINELRAELAQQLLATIRSLADDAQRNQRLEAENAVLRARVGKPWRPVGGG